MLAVGQTAQGQGPAPDALPKLDPPGLPGPIVPAQAGGLIPIPPPGKPAPDVGDINEIRRFDPFGGGHPRLQGLAATQGKLPVGTTPLPNKEAYDKAQKYLGTPIDPQLVMELVVGRQRLVPLKQRPFRIQIGNPGLLQVEFITEKLLTFQGNAVGTTVLNLWFGDKDDEAKQSILSYLVNILPDPEAKERLERIYKALEEEINRAFPDSNVCLFLVADKLVVTGEAKDVVEATKILQIIRASTSSARTATLPVGQVNLNLNVDPLALGPDGLPRQALENFLVGGEQNIVNMLRIPGEQQVMLKVTVAEMSRNAARSLGVNFQIRNNAGTQVFAQNTGTVTANLPFILDQGQINVALQALRSVNLARSLAEPNLVTTNGQPAFFFSGGEFPVPVVTGATAVGLQGVTFVPFGVQVFFTPYIADKDRLRLQINATVSTRDPAIGTTIGGAGVPGLNARTITTTVEMREGQTFAIAGLLQTNLGGMTTRVPFFGDIPFGGQLFRTDSTSAGESELVLLVTPQLVHPLEKHELPPLPGSDYFEPGDLEFYLLGRLESFRDYDYRSPVMDEIHRMAAYRHCELLYFVGPHGHSDDR
jgi:pilus assembly protein CpaC